MNASQNALVASMDAMSADSFVSPKMVELDKVALCSNVVDPVIVETNSCSTAAADYMWHVPMSLYTRVLHVGSYSVDMPQAASIAKDFPGVVSVEYKQRKMRTRCATTCKISGLCLEIGKTDKYADRYIHTVNEYDYPD